LWKKNGSLETIYIDKVQITGNQREKVYPSQYGFKYTRLWSGNRKTYNGYKACPISCSVDS